MAKTPILTITGSDSTGGAGIQADIRVIARLGGEAQSVVTSVTMQNTLGIQEFYDLPAEVVKRQIAAVADDIVPGVVKIGMVRNTLTAKAIVDALRHMRPQWILFSPVAHTSHGEEIMGADVREYIRQHLLPLCHLVVVRRRDAEAFPAEHMMVAEDNHGECNELCSAVAVYLSQGNTLPDAEQKARMAMPQNKSEQGATARVSAIYAEFQQALSQQALASHDVNYYAAMLNVSSRYLTQVTKAVTGQTPKTIIDTTMTERLKQMLLSSKTIQEVAIELGFSSQAHLTNYFKKQMGMTPTDFRKQQG